MKKILKGLAIGILLGLSVLILYLEYPNTEKDVFCYWIILICFLDCYGICSILGIELFNY